MDEAGKRRARLTGLGAFLAQRTFGQGHALERFTARVVGEELGLNLRRNPHSPRASFLLLGPSGVGKTQTAKLATAYLFGEEAPLEIFLMNAHQRLESQDALVRDLGRAVARNPRGTFLLFDEIEKAHPNIVDLFLSLLEEGLLDLADGTRVGLQNFYIVFTSNLGSGELAEMQTSPYATIERIALGVASESLKPELFGRINEKIVYRPFSPETARKVVEDAVHRKLSHFEEKLGCRLGIGSAATWAHLQRAGISRQYGARGLQDEIDRRLNPAVMPFVLDGAKPEQGLFIYDKDTASIVLT